MSNNQTLLTFTDEVLENSLCCVMCNNILTPPITLIQDFGNVCSDCFSDDSKPKPNNCVSLNNHALEKILVVLSLPCKYKNNGCNERMSYQEIITHQLECKFRLRRCPMYELNDCKWQGNSIDFLNHFKEAHPEHVVNLDCSNLFFLETSVDEMDLVKLLVTKRHSFMLRMQTNKVKNKLFYMICCVKETYSPFDYSAKHKGGSNNYIKTKSKVVPFHNLHNEFDENIAVEVDLESLKQISQVWNIIKNFFKIKIEDAQVEGIDEKMLHFFECPVCKLFMKPPIYQCQSGHSVCNACRPRLEKCPSCRAFFGSTRNYSLEGLTSGVQYPCANQDLGCSETATASSIVKHEKECSFKPYSCPFPSCTVIGNHLNIVTHLMNFHSDSVINSGNTSFTETFRIDQNSNYNKIWDRKCVIAFNHIFRVACKRVGDHCLWAAEIYGRYDDSKTFVYEVAIIDTRKPEKKLIKTDYCLIDVNEDDLFKKCIMFPNSLLSSYSNHGIIMFCFTVKEK